MLIFCYGVKKYLLSLPHLTKYGYVFAAAVVTPTPGWLHPAHAGRGPPFPGHIPILPVGAGPGAAAGPKQSQSGFPNQDMTRPAIDLSLLITESLSSSLWLYF